MLLILAGVALATLTGQGNIIGNAENAVGKYNNSVASEQQLLNEIEKYLEKNLNNTIEEEGITLNVTVSTSGITNKVIVTIEGKSEEGIKSLTITGEESKTYPDGTKEIQETIEITSNGTYTVTIENNNGKTVCKEITINNILEGTIGITADKTMPTKDNVKVTISWPSGSEAGIKEIKVGDGEWETVTGESSEVEVEQNCTVEARVRNSEGEITTNSITISNIDKANPIVTATEGEETITEGTSKEISSYFTYASNGTAEITSVAYTDTSDGNATVTNTNTLTVGTHIIKCTVTKETGAVASATKTIVVETSGVTVTIDDIASDPEEHYGGEVTNYTTPSGDPNVKWRIFYADESNVYLIASDYIHYDYAPTSANNTLYKTDSVGYQLSFDNVYKDYTGSANITDPRITKWINYVKDYSTATGYGIQSVAFMLDEARWSAKYANPDYAEYAIGGPTLELWCASYKAAHPDKYVECTYTSTGYQVKWSDSTSSPSYSVSGAEDDNDLYYIKSSTSKCLYMWLASPSASYSDFLVYVGCTGSVSRSSYSSSYTGFRPLVCLQSGIQLEKQNDGTYLIK